jgi:hypothetical protein
MFFAVINLLIICYILPPNDVEVFGMIITTLKTGYFENKPLVPVLVTLYPAIFAVAPQSNILCLLPNLTYPA